MTSSTSLGHPYNRTEKTDSLLSKQKEIGIFHAETNTAESWSQRPRSPEIVCRANTIGVEDSETGVSPALTGCPEQGRSSPPETAGEKAEHCEAVHERSTPSSVAANAMLKQWGSFLNCTNKRLGILGNHVRRLNESESLSGKLRLSNTAGLGGERRG